MLGSALGSAQSALTAAETELQVSAHNLANVHTNGFKASRVRYATAPPQTIHNFPAHGASALEIGQGTKVASIDVDTSPGSVVPDTDPRSFAILGAGYFVLGDANRPLAYSRDGQFYWNASGQLTHSSGLLVWGHNAASNAAGQSSLAPLTNRPGMLTGNSAESVQIDDRGQITSLQPGGTAIPLGSLAVAQFPNPQGLVAEGDNLYTAGPAAGTPQHTAPQGAQIRGGSRELSNTNVAAELVVMLMAATMVRANVPVVQVSDELLREVTSMLPA